MQGMEIAKNGKCIILAGLENARKPACKFNNSATSADP